MAIRRIAPRLHSKRWAHAPVVWAAGTGPRRGRLVHSTVYITLTPDWQAGQPIHPRWGGVGCMAIIGPPVPAPGQFPRHNPGPAKQPGSKVFATHAYQIQDARSHATHPRFSALLFFRDITMASKLEVAGPHIRNLRCPCGLKPQRGPAIYGLAKGTRASSSRHNRSPSMPSIQPAMV